MKEIMDMRSEVRSEIKSLRQELRSTPVKDQERAETAAEAFLSFSKVSSVEELEKNEAIFCSTSEENVSFQVKLVSYLNHISSVISFNSNPFLLHPYRPNLCLHS